MEVPVLLALFGLLVALAGMLLPFVVVGALFLYLYRRRRMSRVAREAAQTWAETIGVVVSSTIKVQRTVRSRSEVPIVLCQYQVEGTPYVGKSIRAGDQFFAIRFAGDARKVVENYPAGAQVTVYYNPARPAESALER